jgi:hypothetical protein
MISGAILEWAAAGFHVPEAANRAGTSGYKKLSKKQIFYPLTIRAVNAQAKKWTRMIDLDHGNYGTHTLRRLVSTNGVKIRHEI